MTTTTPAPTGYTSPHVRALGEDAARDHLRAILGSESAALPLTLKRQQRTRDEIVPWTNYLLYETTGPRGAAGIVVEVDEHQHADPTVVRDVTRIVKSSTPFLAPGWPQRISQHLPARKSASWAKKKLGLTP